MILCLAIRAGVTEELILTDNDAKVEDFETRWLTKAGFLNLSTYTTPDEKKQALEIAEKQYFDIGHDEIDFNIYFDVEPEQSFTNF